MNRQTLGVALALALVCLGTSSAPPVRASSHSEAPGTAKDRLADDTDLYAWVAKDAPQAVTFVGNWVPLLEPNGGPNFYSFDDEAHYYINIDNVGDAQKHIRYEFTFQTTRANPNTFLYNTGVVTSLDDPDLNVRQTYSITRTENGVETVIATGLPVAPNNVGPKSMPNYSDLAAQAVRTLGDGTKVFVGPRDDPFFVDLAAVFDLLTIRKVPGDMGKGVDGLGGYDVLSIVLQVPKARLTKDGQAPEASRSNHIIGIWDTAERMSMRTIQADGSITLGGSEVQVSRLGMPLVNEVVIPLGKKDMFNRSEPVNDVANFGASVVDPELAKLLQLLYGIPVPPAPRNDLVTVFATGIPGLNQPAGVAPGEMLRLNMAMAPASVENRLGVIAGDLAGFPNGRRLADDVVDIELRVVAGVLVSGFNTAPGNRLGDGVDANDRPFLPYFPYVAPPHNPFDHAHHPVQHGASPFSLGAASGALERFEKSPKGTTAMDTEGDVRMRVVGVGTGRGGQLEFTVPSAARVTLRLYDVQGRAVRTLVDQDAASGSFVARWDGRSDDGARMGRGVYFARLTAGSQTAEKKVVIE
jgi:uncharacterized protein DUF4331/flagellar hook capping protein FlgD